MQQQLFRNLIDPAEAPPGYYAVLKSDAKPEDGSNICRACDWRKNCNGTEFRCMSYEIKTDDGKTLQRQDGCSVVFKKEPSNANTDNHAT